jgi:hypothetical protein
VLPKSRPLSRRSACVSAEPYLYAQIRLAYQGCNIRNNRPFTQELDGPGFTPVVLYQNGIKNLLFGPLRLSAERKQILHIVEIPRNWMGLKEALEEVYAPPEQKVRGSNPLGRTNFL